MTHKRKHEGTNGRKKYCEKCTRDEINDDISSYVNIHGTNYILYPSKTQVSIICHCLEQNIS